jgi:peptide deformylase
MTTQKQRAKRMGTTMTEVRRMANAIRRAVGATAAAQQMGVSATAFYYWCGTGSRQTVPTAPMLSKLRRLHERVEGPVRRAAMSKGK